MKKLFCLAFLLFPFAVLAQLPPYQRNPVTTNTPPGMTNAISAAVGGSQNNFSKSNYYAGPIRVGTDVNASVLQVFGQIDMTYSGAISFGGYEGDRTYQIGQASADSLWYDTWRWHRFRYGADGSESPAFETYRENMRIPGGLMVGTISNTTFTALAASEVNALIYGADTNGVSSASAALIAMFAAVPAAGGRVVIPRGTYKIDSTVTLPTWGNYATVSVEAEGAVFNVSPGIVGFDRWPATQVSSAVMVNTKFRWKGGRFIGDNSAGQTAFRFGPTYGGVIEGAHFQSFTNGVIVANGINFEVRNTHFTYCPLILQAGTNSFNGTGWTDATVANSQANHSKIDTCRFFTITGQAFAVGVFDSSAISINQCVFEGLNPTNDILFAAGWAALGGLRIVNTHLEHTPSDSFLRLEHLGRATVTIDGLIYPSGSLLINATNCDTPIINVENVQYLDDVPQFDASTRTLANGTGGQDGTLGWFWNFRNCTGQEGEDFREPKWWVGGVVPLNLSISGAGTSAGNLALITPQWSDTALTYSYSLLGPNAPSLVATTNGSPIQNLALDNGDILYAQGHFPHNVATTNAAFPVFSIRPHVHWTPIGTLDATHSNVTWQIEYEIASTNGFWSLRGTNSITSGVTNNFTLRKTAFDPIEFVVPPGHDAGIRVRLTRPASASQEYGNDHIVLFDGIDMQVPVGNAELLGHSE